MSETAPAAAPRAEPQLRLGVPVSVALGAGSVRGLAHVAVLDVLCQSGFEIPEMVGTSVGAIVAAFYAAVGLDLNAIRAAGLSLKTSHLLSWALLRHAPPSIRDRAMRLAGIIPEHIGWLAAGSFDRMHHGVSRIGIVAHDVLTHSDVICHNVGPVLRLEDAVRGAAALPGLFPPWKCSFGGRQYRLVDGGVRDRLPVDILFRPPFRPTQVLAVDISARPAHRESHLARIALLRRQFPEIPIDILCVDTLGGATVIYRSGYLNDLLRRATEAARDYVSRLRRKEESFVG